MYAGSVYAPDGPKKLKNIVFTLVAKRTGRFIIPGASARVNGELIKSDNAFVEVISQEEAIKKGVLLKAREANTDLFLSPGENAQEKIRRNLFLQVVVDKKNCYVGEPVTAVFKLYSRLISKSDILKNPGFYGFTVQDMIGLKDNLSSTQTINGKLFDVHTIRKVQLYPLRAGLFTIDAMEVMNKVEFSKAAINKNLEQQITEGVVPENNDAVNTNTEVVESSMHTDEIPITVKELPAKTQPASYNGAVGNFKIVTSVKRLSVHKNEEDSFLISIQGKGNFTQLSAPAIQWPKGVEGFEPEIKDSLDYSISPMKGERIFMYRFIAGKAGKYVLPATNFSFFDPDSGSYKTVSTSPIEVNVDDQERQGVTSTEQTALKKKNSQQLYWMAAGLLLLVTGTAYFFYRAKKRKATALQVVPIENVQQHLSVEDVLVPAYLLVNGDDKLFYTSLHQAAWKYFAFHFALSGSEMKKEKLFSLLKQKGIAADKVKAVSDFLQQAETGMFTAADMGTDKAVFLKEVKDLLKSIALS